MEALRLRAADYILASNLHLTFCTCLTFRLLARTAAYRLYIVPHPDPTPIARYAFPNTTATDVVYLPAFALVAMPAFRLTVAVTYPVRTRLDVVYH